MAIPIIIFIFKIWLLLKNKHWIFTEQAHSSVERAGLLGGIRFRCLPTDDEYRLRGSTLENAIKEDREKGLIPFYVSFCCFPFVTIFSGQWYFIPRLSKGFKKLQNVIPEFNSVFFHLKFNFSKFGLIFL